MRSLYSSRGLIDDRDKSRQCESFVQRSSLNHRTLNDYAAHTSTYIRNTEHECPLASPYGSQATPFNFGLTFEFRGEDRL